MTIVSIHMAENLGLTEFTLYLRKTSDGTLLNTGGDALTEDPAGSGRFTADVGESWSETLAAVVLDSNSLAVRDGWLAVGETIVRDSYPLGLTNGQQAQLDAIQASTALIGAGTRITVKADSGQSITLKIGDDYAAANSTAKRIQVNDADSAIYNLLTDNTLAARSFGFGVSGNRDLVIGTIDRATVTHTAAAGATPAYTTVFVEMSVSADLQAQTGKYDVQVTHASGKKQTVFSGDCTLEADNKS